LRLDGWCRVSRLYEAQTFEERGHLLIGERDRRAALLRLFLAAALAIATLEQKRYRAPVGIILEPADEV
jgi:hypothetical protein